MLRKPNLCCLSAVCVSPSWSLSTLNYSHPEWLKSSASANREEVIQVVPLLAALELRYIKEWVSFYFV